MTNTNIENNNTVTAATTTNVTKKTKRDFYVRLIEVVSNIHDLDDQDTLLDFLNRQITSLDNAYASKSSRSAKKGHEVILNAIVQVLSKPEVNDVLTIGELMTFPELSSYEEEEGGTTVTTTMSNQKLTSMVSKLVKAGTVTKVQGPKKRSYFVLTTRVDEILKDSSNN